GSAGRCRARSRGCSSAALAESPDFTTAGKPCLCRYLLLRRLDSRQPAPDQAKREIGPLGLAHVRAARQDVELRSSDQLMRLADRRRGHLVELAAEQQRRHLDRAKLARDVEVLER